MQLRKIQNITTIIFLVLMFINIACCHSFNGIGSFKILISLYGTHLSVIIAYYFNPVDIKNVVIPPFRFVFLNTLLVFWNVLIFSIVYSSESNLVLLTKRLTEFPIYAGFLIAIGIVWLFNSNSSVET